MTEKIVAPAASPEAALYRALVLAQKTAQAVAKDSKNSFHNYKYASAEAVIEEARGALSTAGLAVFPLGWSIILPGDNGRGLGAVRVCYRLAHESGVFLDFPPAETAVIPEKGRPEDKAEATALTYNLGYFLRGLLLLPREEADANPDKRDDRTYEPKKPPEPIDEDKAEAVYLEFVEAFARATDAKRVGEIATAIKRAHEGRQLTDDHRKKLLKVYGERVAALAPKVEAKA